MELILQDNHVRYIYKALTAQQAFDILKIHPIDAILLDVMMPDIDGIQACKTIRENKSYDTIPIIMVTAVDDNDTFKESFEVGADDFVPKPINDVVLLSRLRSQLEKHQMHKTLIEQSRFSAMDEIISMLAHQWRQPLSIINTITNTVRTKIMLQGIQPTDLENYFNKIEANTEALSQMINSFKTSFSASHSVSCTDISYTINEVCELNKKSIDDLGIKMVLEIDSLDSMMLAKQSLIQVISHLLKNCFDSFSRTSVDNPTIEISLKKNAETMTLTINDNGEGISENDMKHIYEPYFSTKREKNGKGLGLYFAKQLAIKQLDGSLVIHSKPGETLAVVSIKSGDLC